MKFRIMQSISGTLLCSALAAAQSGDSFLWLEEIEGAKAIEWVRGQNARTLEELQSDPRYEEIHQGALEILTSQKRLPLGQIHADHLYNFWKDDKHIRGIWRRASLASYRSGDPKWETLLDVDALAKSEGENWVYKASTCLEPDCQRSMIRLSRGGSDAAVLREFSVPDRTFVEDGFEVSEGKNEVDWLDRDTLLVSSDWGEGRTESGYPRIVRKWTRGQRFDEAETVFEGDVTDVGTFGTVLRHSANQYSFIVRFLTFFESEWRWLRPDGEIKLLPIPKRASPEGVLDGRALVLLKEPWNHGDASYPEGALVALRLEDMSSELVFEPRPQQALSEVAVGKTSAVVTYLEDVIGKAQRLIPTENGWHGRDIEVPPNGVVRIAGASVERDDYFLLYESLTTPQTLFHASEDDKLSPAMSLPAFYDASRVIVEQHFARSKDGTRVPYFVMGRKDVLEKGDAPTIQYGYGGFMVPVVPLYFANSSGVEYGGLAGKLWVSRGGVLVLSNIRGGGEYGPGWHQAALKENRQRAFDDFFSVAEDLIRRGITSPKRLGANGNSNGGLLMGVALTQRPDLYAAIGCGVPLFDMKRYNKLLAGASWMAEYGNPDIPEQWAYLSKYSPYHNLKGNQPYPKVFFYTSTKDDRVHPGHARKAAALLAEHGYKFLYYENIEGGHGAATNQEQLAMFSALKFVYFARQLMPAEDRAAQSGASEGRRP